MEFESLRYPIDASEQFFLLPPEEIRSEVCGSLFRGLVFLLENNGVEIDKEASSYRAKTAGRIKEKIIRRGSNDPILDIYGIQLITEYPDRDEIIKIIQSAYPETPKTFNQDKPSVRDYSKNPVREGFRAKFNPNITDSYTALHINIVFSMVGSNIYNIAEIQVMNHKEHEAAEKTRHSYVTAQKSMFSGTL